MCVRGLGGKRGTLLLQKYKWLRVSGWRVDFKPERDKDLVKQSRAASVAPEPGGGRCSVIPWTADCTNDDLLICGIKQFCISLLLTAPIIKGLGVPSVYDASSRG